MPRVGLQRHKKNKVDNDDNFLLNIKLLNAAWLLSQRYCKFGNTAPKALHKNCCP